MVQKLVINVKASWFYNFSTQNNFGINVASTGKPIYKMKLPFTYTFFALFISICSIAQTSSFAKDSSLYGSVKVNQDPRFEELSTKQAEINKNAQKYIVKHVKGWRIQASNTQNRDEANSVKTILLQKFPDEKTYLLYQAPNFRVRIGNFLTQKDAFNLRKQISALYPAKGIYIVADIIDVAPTPDDEDELNN